MKIAVVGIGVVGKALVEHFEHLGNEVLPVEKDSTLKLAEAAQQADIVFVVTRPIREVGEVLKEAVKNMRPGTFLVNGASVQNPKGQSLNLTESERGITVAHIHFQFRPAIPLRETFRGQHITVKLQGDRSWMSWIKDTFGQFRPFIHEVDENKHDETTALSQVVHMIIAHQLGHIWKTAAPAELERALTIMGAPGKFLARSVLRSSSGAGVAAEIIVEHPRSLEVIAFMEESLAELKAFVKEGANEKIERVIGSSRSLISKVRLADFEARTNQLMRLEADLQRDNVVFHFGSEKNVIGLLARVLSEFDKRGIDKTTTIAQTNADGSCTFVIGVRERTPVVDEVEAIVKSWA